MFCPPEECYGSGLGDHAPLILSWGRRPKPQHVSDSVPRFLFKQAYFKTDLGSIVEDIDLSNLTTHRQLPMYKAPIKEAARRV